jgi:hypothetical protein
LNVGDKIYLTQNQIMAANSIEFDGEFYNFVGNSEHSIIGVVK